MKWFSLGFVVLLSAFYYALPWLSRRDLFFSVTVAPDFRDTEAARAILRRYRSRLLAGCGLALLLGSFLPFPKRSVVNVWEVLLVQLLAYGFAYATAHRAARSYRAQPVSVREVELLPREGSVFERPAVMLAGLVLLAACFAVAFSIPAPSGQVPLLGGWSAIVSRWNVLEARAESPISFCLGMWTSFLPLMLIFRFTTRRQAAIDSSRRYTILRSFTLVSYALSLFLSGVLIAAVSGQVVTRVATRYFLVVVAVGMVAHWALLIRGSRRHALVGDVPLGDRTPDECWKLGILYYNREDPALLVEGRDGPGYTLNFGHWASWLLAAAFVAALLLPALVCHR